MNNLLYTKLTVQGYLKSRDISVKAAKNLFKWRTRSACFKTNYKNHYSNLLCPFGHNVDDSQEHSLSCFQERNGFKISFKYSDLFKSNISFDVATTLLKISKSREDASLWGPSASAPSQIMRISMMHTINCIVVIWFRIQYIYWQAKLLSGWGNFDWSPWFVTKFLVKRKKINILWFRIFLLLDFHGLWLGPEIFFCPKIFLAGS